MALRPNPDCASSWCRRRQAEYAAKAPEREAAAAAAAAAEAEAAAIAGAALLHETNEWGIEVGGDDGEEEAAAPAGPAAAPPPAAPPPAAPPPAAPSAAPAAEAASDGVDLSDLMAQLKGVQS